MTMNTPVLPDFCRWQWSSVTARQYFRPHFQEASSAFTQLERLSVARGIRKAAWQFTTHENLVSLTAWAQQNGLLVVPLQHVHQSGSYSSSGGNNGNPNAYRVVITRPEHVTEVFPFTDDDKIGSLLGFPACCRAAFAETWGRGQVDTTYEQVKNTAVHDWRASTLLRFMGVRLIAHLPCSYSCQASIDIGQQFFDLGIAQGFKEEMLFAKEVLQWSAAGSRLFGINEMLVGGALKLVVRTNWTDDKETFFVKGAAPYVKPSEELWTLNGFKDYSAMRSTHGQLLNILKERVPQGARMLDLGCGNAALLKRVKLHRPDITICGVDLNEDAIGRVPMLSGKFRAERIEVGSWSEWNADVAIITPGRLLEMEAADAELTRQRLSRIPHLFLYAYADWKEPLEELATKAGFGPIEMLAKLPQVSVGRLIGEK